MALGYEFAGGVWHHQIVFFDVWRWLNKNNPIVRKRRVFGLMRLILKSYVGSPVKLSVRTPGERKKSSPKINSIHVLTNEETSVA